MSTVKAPSRPTSGPRRPAAGVTLLRAGDQGWDAARATFNLTVDQQPAAIAMPRSDAEVVAAVALARRQGLQVAVQRTGHNAEPLGPLDRTMLLRTDRLGGVAIDADRRVARVGAGATWGDLVPKASELGLAALHGSTPNVSIAGYSLGGGVGWYARKHGLATNSLLAIELVTADGRLRRVDADNDPDLFWALRGGGGNFGVVTALELRLFPIEEVYAGVLFFPAERAAEILHAWRAWVDTVPDEVTSVGRIMQFPPLEQVPEPMRGKSFVLVEAVVLGDEDEGRELLRPLRELGPAVDTFAMTPPAGIADLHMDPPSPVPYAGSHQLLGDLSPEAIDAVVAVTGPGSSSPLVSFELRHIGGAVARDGSGHGALSSFPERFLTFGVGMVVDEASRTAVRERLGLVAHALAAHDTGRQYLNFTETRSDPARFFTPEAWMRLRAAKATIDPDNLFRANHAFVR